MKKQNYEDHKEEWKKDVVFGFPKHTYPTSSPLQSRIDELEKVLRNVVEDCPISFRDLELELKVLKWIKQYGQK
jgi:hypothetical protein